MFFPIGDVTIIWSTPTSFRVFILFIISSGVPVSENLLINSSFTNLTALPMFPLHRLM